MYSCFSVDAARSCRAQSGSTGQSFSVSSRNYPSHYDRYGSDLQSLV